jgi:hypothetical protein
MKTKDMIDMLKGFDPECDLCISKYMVIVEPADSTSEYFCVVDNPIIGVIQNDDTKELRFMVESSEERAIKMIEENEWKKLDE